MSDSLWPRGLYSPWNSPGQNTGVGNLSLFQGIFSTQVSNSGLPHCRRILYQLSDQGSPRILEWVAYPFSSRCSWPRNGTGVSCIAGRFFTNWAIREAPVYIREFIHFFIWYSIEPKESITKQNKSHKCFGFPVDIKIMFILHCSLLSVQQHYILKCAYLN